ncbi:hypothetical protein [Sphingomonas nostoxanthinifaciens]|uniref:hypothetical protein n=1 Tax=Sphingomonas nostoxanthinifaciens TaxID=2872652 RepID=UPI001CC2060C|nr:hypothetical protein [Sphingomonas nostoxanthinifaciens]UAK22889.1 hypothetical protein K8P63_10605 [Sphingomonas nostoxanthinifaciens]
MTMSPKPLLALLLAASPLAALQAQSTDNIGRTPQEEYQRGYAATPMPGQAAADAQSQPAVQSLNAQAAGAAQAQAATAGQPSPEAQAQYDADRAAYMDALAKHDMAVDRTNIRYVRQQRAYADAMAVWRVQVMACKKGKQRACDMPPPNPADYY